MSLLIQFIVVATAAWFGNYLQQKGKNLATKEDISKITNEIEAVKNEFKKRHELSTVQRDYYIKMVEVMQNFLAHLSRYEVVHNMQPNSITSEIVMGDEYLRRDYLEFIDKENSLTTQLYVFSDEKNWENFSDLFRFPQFLLVDSKNMCKMELCIPD